MARALQQLFLVPGERALEEIVARLTVGERIDVGQNQPFFGIGDQRVIIDRVKFLLLVVDAHQVTLVAVRVYRLVGGQHDAGGVFRIDVRVVAQRAERRGDNALRYTLVGDAGDVVDLHALVTLCHVQVFAAQLQAVYVLGAVAVHFL